MIKKILLAISFLAIATYSLAAGINNPSDDILAGITPMSDAEMQQVTGEDITIIVFYPSHPEDNIYTYQKNSYVYIYYKANGDTGEVLVDINQPIPQG